MHDRDGIVIQKRALSRRAFLGISTGAGAVLALLAMRTVPVRAASKPQVYTGLVDGVGAGGYDVVAYFKQNKPVAGDAAITAKHNGATWRFSSVENRDAFAANPGKYAPEYGGYCAYAAAEGYTAKGDPHAWSVHKGKLYLNYSKRVRQLWSQDIAGNIARGDANWPDILN